MTLQITNINSARYSAEGTVVFNVDCGDILNVSAIIQNNSRDFYNDRLLSAWLLTNTPEAYIRPVVIEEDPIDLRRQERRETFGYTLDLMNPIWYNSLTVTQQTNLATWRTAWLDYPETGTKPADTLIEGVFT